MRVIKQTVCDCREIEPNMNVIITEPFDSFWSPHCASDNNNASVPWRRDFFIKFPDFGVDGYVDLETVILLAVKFALLCIALYLAKCVLFFVHWLLFLPFNWTRVSEFNVKWDEL